MQDRSEQKVDELTELKKNSDGIKVELERYKRILKQRGKHLYRHRVRYGILNTSLRKRRQSWQRQRGRIERHWRLLHLRKSRQSLLSTKNLQSRRKVSGEGQKGKRHNG
jgi:hypothetical protein